MKEIQKITVGVAGILLMGAINQSGAAVITDFTVPPLGAWTQYENDGNSPGATYSDTATTLIFTAPNATSGTFPLPYNSVMASDQFTGAYTLDVNLTVTPWDDAGTVTGSWVVGTVPNPKGINVVSFGSVVSSGTASENFLINIPAGDYLNFVIAGSGKDGGGKTPADLDVTIIPEASTWLAGVFLVGVLWIAAIRQKQPGTANCQS